MPLFLVTSEQGPDWLPGVPMRQQKGWDDHARFMNALAEEGLVRLGGPAGDGRVHRAVLVLDGSDLPTVRARLAEDPWMRDGILRIESVQSWELLLGELPSRPERP